MKPLATAIAEDEKDGVQGREHLRVVTRLERLHIIGLPCAFGAGDEVIQALVDDRQISMELPLTWHYPARDGDVPIGDVEGRPVLCLLEHSIHCLVQAHSPLNSHANLRVTYEAEVKAAQTQSQMIYA